MGKRASRQESMARRLALSLALGCAAATHLQVGDMVPVGELHYGFPPEKIDIHERIMGKKVVLVGLPGAFTPT